MVDRYPGFIPELKAFLSILLLWLPLLLLLATVTAKLAIDMLRAGDFDAPADLPELKPVEDKTEMPEVTRPERKAA